MSLKKDILGLAGGVTGNLASLWNKPKSPTMTDQLIEQLRGEIVYLRAALKDQQDRFFALNEHAVRAYQAVRFTDHPPPAPTYVDPMGRLTSMEATTEEEIQQKADAERQMRQILGGQEYET